jgi:PAS domain S-box-containing protein
MPDASPPRSAPRPPSRPLAWLVPATVALAAIVLVLVVVAVAAFAALAGARSLAQGESNWSRNQKDMILGMQRHAATGGAEGLALARQASAFHGQVETVLSMIEAGNPDRRALQEATAAVPGFEGEAGPFARAFVWFEGFAFTRQALEEWRAAQDRVAGIQALLDPLEAAVAEGDVARVQEILATAHFWDEEIETFRHHFFEASDAWARTAGRGSGAALAAFGFLFVLLGFLGIRFVLVRLDRSEREVAESRDRFQQVTEGIREVFWLTTPDKSEMLYVSPAYEQIWGEPTDHLMKNPLTWMDAIVPEDRDEVLKSLERQGREEVETEYRIRAPGGGVRWIRERAYPILGADGQLMRIAGLSEDITERKALEEELLQAHKLRSVARLAGGIAHEFNNLLTAIRSHVQFLETDLADRSEFQEDLEGIRSSAARAETLTRKLLAFGRQQVVLPAPLSVERLLDDIQPLLVSILPPGVVLEIHRVPDLPLVRADREHLREALLSLVTNAREAMDRRGLIRIEARLLGWGDCAPEAPHHIPVEGRALKGRDYLVLEVGDDGYGIPPELRPRIFEPFSRGRHGASAQGLGLPAVLGLMEQMDGGLRLDSTPGEGTRVRLYLPIDLPHADAERSPAGAAAGPTEPGKAGPEGPPPMDSTGSGEEARGS